MQSISWTVANRRADLSAIRAALAAERRETVARHEKERQRVLDANQADRDAKKVGAAIRKAVREQDRASRRIGAIVAAKKLGSDSGRTCKRFEAMLHLNPPKPSAQGRDGLSSFHFKWTSRGYGGATGSRRYRAGEAVRHLKYIQREQAREIEGGGLVSSISRDTAELAGFFQALETLEGQDRANANVYVTLVISLPHELAVVERERVLGEICEVLAKLDLPYVGVLHAPGPLGDPRNYHAHVMLGLRPTKVIAPGQYEFSPVKSSDLNDGSFIVEYRHTVATLLNAAMERGGHDRRFTALSNAERGLAPTAKGTGKSTPGKKNISRRAQRLAEARAALAQNHHRQEVIIQLREKIVAFLAEPFRDFEAELATRRADLQQRTEQRRALAASNVAATLAAQQTMASADVVQSAPATGNEADLADGTASPPLRPVARAQPSPAVTDLRDAAGPTRNADTRAPARIAPAPSSAAVPVDTPVMPSAAFLTPVAEAAAQSAIAAITAVEPAPAPIAATAPTAPTVARAQPPVATVTESSDVPSDWPTHASQAVATDNVSGPTPSEALQPTQPLVALEAGTPAATAPDPPVPASLAGSQAATVTIAGGQRKRGRGAITARLKEMLAASQGQPPREPEFVVTSNAVPPGEHVENAVVSAGSSISGGSVEPAATSSHSPTPIRISGPDGVPRSVASAERAPSPVRREVRPKQDENLLAAVWRFQENIRKKHDEEDGPDLSGKGLRSLRDILSLSQIPLASELQLLSIGVKFGDQRREPKTSDGVGQLTADGRRAETTAVAPVDGTQNSTVATAKAPVLRNPVRKQNAAMLPAGRMIAPVDPARTAAIEAVVQDLHKRTYLPLIKRPDGTLKLVLAAVTDKVLIAADWFDSDPSIQATFQSVRRAMLSDLAVFFETCRVSPFEVRGGTSVLQVSRLDAELKEAVKVAKGDTDVIAVVQAGAELWRQREKRARQDEKLKQQRVAAKRKQQGERQDLLNAIHAEIVFGTLPGAWESAELEAAEPPVADLVSSLASEGVWLERTDAGFAVYGKDETAQAAVTELAKTRIGQAILERLATAVAEPRPEHGKGSPLLVVQRTGIRADHDPDWPPAWAGRGGRGGR
ncbi:hypothetical protein [Glacieibacterium frigidum]|uniref:MobA/MobL protein domain-containing protein n=1 Tax=Glacieibacterium frigidum TaxID=2593303 RepID=A0A552U8E8_9SPHN|nr:hypothetical protein [Glacieibacterium frigidum]TRW14490.1 hypothetical protein FMM06_12350 [Glacieibacterium frigidum]